MKKLFRLWGIRDRRDLKETLYLAGLVLDSRRGVKVVLPEVHSELLRTTRQVRHLAFKRSFADLREKWTPPNSPEEMDLLVRLIKLDPSQLATWYVQKLIRQIHDWRFQGDGAAIDEAQKLARSIGAALALALERGGQRVPVEPSETWRVYSELRQILAPLFDATPLSERGADFSLKIRNWLQKKYPTVSLALRKGQQGIPPFGQLEYWEKTASYAARFLTAEVLDISEGTVRRHIRIIRSERPTK